MKHTKIKLQLAAEASNQNFQKRNRKITEKKYRKKLVCCKNKIKQDEREKINYLKDWEITERKASYYG